MNEFRVLNDKGDIEVKILKPVNAVFQTDEFPVDSTITVYKNAFNIFNLVLENQQLKEKVKYLEDNRNKLKEYLHNQIPTDKTVLTKYIKIFEVLDKMQELERNDNNEDIKK